MSCQTAPVALVATPTTAGLTGSDRLRAVSNRPSAASLALSASNLQRQVAEPGRLERGHVQLVDALRLEHVDATVDDDSQPRPRLERRTQSVVAEEDAGELASFVLQGEVGVTRRRDGDSPNFALDPDVAQPVLGTNCVSYGTRNLADLEDSQREAPCRLGARLLRRIGPGSLRARGRLRRWCRFASRLRESSPTMAAPSRAASIHRR